MTKLELTVFILNIGALLIGNILLFKVKRPVYEMKYSGLYFLLVKMTVLFPGLFTMLQLYVFSFDYIPYIGSAMHYLVMYQWIGYLIIFGFIALMEENQVKLLMVCSCISTIFQFYIGYQIINNQAVVKLLGPDNLYNMFAYGDAFGIILCLLGGLLSLLGLLTCFHYYHKNNHSDFTF